jgi:hypothetical protein
MNAIDTASDVRPYLACLKAQGILAIGRYACKSTSIVGKKLEPIEAQAIAAAGFKIFTAWEQGDATHVDRFTEAQGAQDADDFLAWAAGVGQPRGSGVFPTVDFDATATDLAGPLLQYIRAFQTAVLAGGYRMGIYGSWRTCRSFLESGLVTLAWLAGADDWAEHAQGLGSGQCAIIQIPGSVCGLPSDVTDRDQTYGEDYGAWVPVGTSTRTDA